MMLLHLLMVLPRLLNLLDGAHGIHSPASANKENMNDGIKVGNRVDVVVLVESIRTISERYANTAYGFFLGKVAYLVVANYVRNTWGKYGQ
ncbi:hypothetical protein Tco_1388459, partial [Tanacetum coccineum]